MSIGAGGVTIGFWASCPLSQDGAGARAAFRLRAGEEVWAVLSHGGSPSEWTIVRADEALQGTNRYWQDWSRSLIYSGPRGKQVRRCALTVHLLSYAPAGSPVAAPTTSLPERLGGDRNYDYRFAWVRDASLSLAVMSLLGQTRAARRYLDWLAGLGSSTDSPLQVVYGIDGRTDLTERHRWDLTGYLRSLPIRFGNHAFGQTQLDSLGYLADCALIYLTQGGIWRPEYWEMIRRAADYTARNWRRPDNGVWELTDQAHYVSSKVMGWVALDRAVEIAERTGRGGETEIWRATLVEIRADVLAQGWSDRLGAFRQRYGVDTLDASALLIPVMGFLPADDPRVLGTIRRIVETLTIDGYVHRFLAAEMPGHGDRPLGEFEGAFLPCTFWLATTYAKAGLPDLAEAILARTGAAAGELGLFAEEIDAQTGAFLGNTPLLCSQVEYVRAILELAKSRSIDRARLMFGPVQHRLDYLIHRAKSNSES